MSDMRDVFVLVEGSSAREPLGQIDVAGDMHPSRELARLLREIADDLDRLCERDGV